MTLKQKSNIYATVGTIIMMLLLFLLLWFVYLAQPTLPEDEGIEVAFGNADEGGGFQQEQTESTPVVSVTPPPAPASPSNNDLITQEDEESLALQKQREQDKKRKEQELAEAERLRKEKEAAEARAEAERRAREQALAEQRAKEQAARDKAAAMGSLFGNNGSDATGSGDSQGDSQKGNPVGHGSIGGNEWSLSGRGAKAIPKPRNDFKQEGRVVVTIRVNASGDVIEARQSGGDVSDPTTVKLAIDAAKLAKFTPSDNSQQVGTITYYFKFN